MKNDMINCYLVETESKQILNYPKRRQKDNACYLKIQQITTFITKESNLSTAGFGESQIFP